MTERLTAELCRGKSPRDLAAIGNLGLEDWCHEARGRRPGVRRCIQQYYSEIMLKMLNATPDPRVDPGVCDPEVPEPDPKVLRGVPKTGVMVARGLSS